MSVGRNAKKQLRELVTDGTVTTTNVSFVRNLSLVVSFPVISTVIGYEPSNYNDAELYLPREQDYSVDINEPITSPDIARLLYHGRIIRQYSNYKEGYFDYTHFSELENCSSLEETQRRVKLLHSRALSELHFLRIDLYINDRTYKELRLNLILYHPEIPFSKVSSALTWMALNGWVQRKAIIRVDDVRPIYAYLKEVLIPDLANIVLAYILPTK